MKPILYKTDMVRAILEDRKTVTRRVVKPQPKFAKMTMAGLMMSDNPITIDAGIISTKKGDVTTWEKLPYRPGDILYVRETWCWCPCWDCGMDTEEGCVDEIAERFYNDQKAEWGCYGYKASFEPNEAPFDRWHPSIHMPREAARIFLRVTGVRVERLRDITEEQAQTEGLYKGWQLTEGSSPAATARQAFMWVWDMTVKSPKRHLYGWMGNPWVWVIEFERCEKPEGGT